MSRGGKEQRPEEWTGTRSIIPLKDQCTLCRDTKCERCCHEIAWYEKLWVCPCACNKNWKPKNVVVEKKSAASKEAVESTPQTSVST